MRGGICVKTKMQSHFVNAMLPSWIAVVCLAICSLALAVEPAVATAPETPEGLIDAVSHLPPGLEFDAQRIEQFVEQFNKGQLRKYKVDPEQMFGVPEGFANAKFEDHDPYFALLFTQVTTTHTDNIGIDGGIDRIFTVFWTKQPLRFVSQLDGITDSFPDPDLRLVVPTQEDCLGKTPTGSFSVHDLSADQTIFSAELPERTLGVFDAQPLDDSTLDFGVYVEESFDDSPNAKQCEVGEWVKRIHYMYSLTCDRGRARCDLKSRIETVDEGCSSIGECD